MNKFNRLYTEETMNQEFPLSEYPFPQFKRDSYVSLNGAWDYNITNNQNEFLEMNGKNLVPFPIESHASKVEKRIQKDEYINYKKQFNIDENFIKKHTIIHFLGVDQTYYIILNGIKFEKVTPLNFPTKIDISKAIQENNE